MEAKKVLWWSIETNLVKATKSMGMVVSLPLGDDIQKNDTDLSLASFLALGHHKGAIFAHASAWVVASCSVGSSTIMMAT